MILEKLPETILKATPHIGSCVKILKKQYNAIAEMLGPTCSGFGWNDRQKCIDCLKDVFDEWFKSHPTAKGLRDKPFPHLEELTIVFGKDRANGFGARGPADMVEEVNGERNDPHWEEFDDFYIPDPPVEPSEPYNTMNEDVNGSSSNGIPMGAPNKNPSYGKSRTKRANKGDDVASTITKTMDKLGILNEKATENVGKIATYFEREAEGQERRAMIFNELITIPGVTTDEVVRASRILIKDHDQTHLFFSLTIDYKTAFIRQMLADSSI